jgi:hypothetical protein
MGCHLFLAAALLFCMGSAQALHAQALPTNDECGGSFPLLGGLNGPFTNVGATNSPLPNWTCGVNGAFAPVGDVWFRCIPSANGIMSLDLCSTSDVQFDPVMQVLTGIAVGHGRWLPATTTVAAASLAFQGSPSPQV